MQRGIEVAAVMRAAIAGIGVFVLDQSAKALARTYRPSGAFFCFTENSGIAFSLPVRGALLWVVTGAALLALAAIAIRALRSGSARDLVAMALIASGGASNVIDRLRFGAVTDIFALHGGLLFNIADVAIIVGLLFFLCPNKFLPRPS